jgi:hypothetical protein
MFVITEKPSKQRFILSMFWLSFIGALMIMDGMAFIDLSKWGYGALGSWATLIIQFYVRRASQSESSQGNNNLEGK